MKHITSGNNSDPLPAASVAHDKFVVPGDGVRKPSVVQAEIIGIPEDFAQMALLFERLLRIFELTKKLRERGADPDNLMPPRAQDGDVDPDCKLLLEEQGETRRLVEQLQAKADKLKSRRWLEKALAQMPGESRRETAAAGENRRATQVSDVLRLPGNAGILEHTVPRLRVYGLSGIHHPEHLQFSPPWAHGRLRAKSWPNLIDPRPREADKPKESPITSR
jgi:hypothetical protein